MQAVFLSVQLPFYVRLITNIIIVVVMVTGPSDAVQY